MGQVVQHPAQFLSHLPRSCRNDAPRRPRGDGTRNGYRHTAQSGTRPNFPWSPLIDTTPVAQNLQRWRVERSSSVSLYSEQYRERPQVQGPGRVGTRLDGNLRGGVRTHPSRDRRRQLWQHFTHHVTSVSRRQSVPLFNASDPNRKTHSSPRRRPFQTQGKEEPPSAPPSSCPPPTPSRHHQPRHPPVAPTPSRCPTRSPFHQLTNFPTMWQDLPPSTGPYR